MRRPNPQQLLSADPTVTSRTNWVCVLFDTIDVKRSHLSIEVGSLDAERLGGVADSSPMLCDDSRDVFLLEPRSRLTQRAATFGGRRRTAIQRQLSQEILDTDDRAAIEGRNDGFEKPAKFIAVAAPR